MAYAMKLGIMLLLVTVMSCAPALVWSQRTYDDTWKDDGRITFYGQPNGGGTQGGACGYQDTVKLGYGYMTAALSTPLFQGGLGCGGCYELRCKAIKETNTAKNWCFSYTNSIVVTATNLCPPGSEGGWCDLPNKHFDLSVPAFDKLARRVGGVSQVYYRRVRCKKQGGVRFTLGGNPWFHMILIHNVGSAGDVVAVKISDSIFSSKSSNSSVIWHPMYRNWGAIWTVRKQLNGALSFQITTGDTKTHTTINAIGNGWKFGQTWEGTQIREQ